MITTAAFRSEILNVRSTPTAKLLLLASMVMAVASLSANLAAYPTEELAAESTLAQLMHSSTVATLTFALVAGVVGATSDFRFGRMDQLLLTEPRRGVVLACKAVVGFLLGVIYGIAGSVAALAGLWSWYQFKDVPVDLTSSVVARPLLGVIVGSGLFVMIGVAVGIAVKNQPMALGGSLALLLIVQPTLLLGVPDVGRWLPGAAGLSVTVVPDPALISQIPGGLLLAAWTVVAMAVAHRRLQTADL